MRPQQFAQRRDLHLQVVFLNDQPGPDQIEQLVLAHDPIAALDQRQQHIEGASAQFGGHPVHEQLSRLGLHFKGSKSYGVGAHGQSLRAMRTT